MHKQRVWVSAALFVFVLWVDGSAGYISNDACKGQVNGNNYDLTQLQTQTGNADASAQDPTGATYFYHPCSPLITVKCNDPNAAVCQIDTSTPPNIRSCGLLTDVSWASRGAGLDDKGFVMTFAGGDAGRQTFLEFVCDGNAGVGMLVTKNPVEKPAQHYHLQWTSSYVCPLSDGGKLGLKISGGWLFLIFLVVGVSLYFSLGVLVNRFYFNKYGLELIPHAGLWIALPGLVRDGHLYVWRKCVCLCCCEWGYERV